MDKKTVDETEYDFDDTQDFSAFSDQNKKASLIDKLKSKTAYLALGIIIIVLVIYKLLSMLFTSSPSQLAHGVQAPGAEVTAGKAVQPVANQSDKSEINSKLAIIENKSIEDRAKFAEGLRSVSQLETSVASLQAQVNSLNERLQEFSNQLKQLNEQKQPVKKAKAILPKVKEEKRPVYFVQALVPERAWLKQADGSMITVARGDIIPGYGEVSVIDISQGVVLTTKGDIIGFHPNEK